MAEPNSVNLETFNSDYQEFFSEVKNSELIDDSDFLENILTKEGSWFSKENFSNDAPGQKYQYTNIGATLAAHVIEQVTGIQYEKYIVDNIFKPLNMQNSSWSKNNDNNPIFATRYLPIDIVVPDYELITKADGGIITNTSDMGNYISEMLNGIDNKGNLLSSDSYRTVFSSKKFVNAKSGIFWSENKSGNPQHSGGDPGILTVLVINPSKNIGLFFMTNISADEDENLINSVKQIFQVLKNYDW